MESLRQHLYQYGWTDKDLNPTNTYARIGLSNVNGLGKVACFEAFSAIRRMTKNKVILVRKVLCPGQKVKFLKSLKYDVIGKPSLFECIKSPFGGLMEIIIWFYEIITKTKVDEMSVIELALDEYNASPASEFPFDAELEVVTINNMVGVYKDIEGNFWQIKHLILSNVTQIEVEVQAS